MTQPGHHCPKCDEILKRAEEQNNKAKIKQKYWYVMENNGS